MKNTFFILLFAILFSSSFGIAQNNVILTADGKHSKTGVTVDTKEILPINRNAVKNHFNDFNNITNLDQILFYDMPTSGNSDFGTFGQDWLIQWFEAPADMIIHRAGVNCVANYDTTGAELKLVKFSWAVDEIQNIGVTNLGYYEALGNGFNDITAFLDNIDRTGDWVEVNGNGTSPFAKDLWSDFGFGAPILPTPSGAANVWEWVDMSLLGFLPTVSDGEIIGVAVRDASTTFDEDRIGWLANNDLGITGFKFYANGRLISGGPGVGDCGWWSRAYTWDFALDVTLLDDATININIPDVVVGNGKSIGDEIRVMLTSSDLSGLGVVSFEFTVTYNDSVVIATGINTSGTISGSSAWNIQANTDTPGEINVTGFGVSELTGSGDFIELLFDVASEPGYTDLSSTNFIFNSGVPSANVTNGSITINVCPEIAVEIPEVDATSLNIGEEIHVMTTASDLTGLGVVSFECTLSYNPELITFVGINTDGTISGADGWTVTVNSETPGIININGFGASELTGSGDFIEIIFTKDNDYGESDLISTSWLFNDGCPTANVTNGSILLPIELTSFTGTAKENNIILQWITASEVNNKGFELFRNGEKIDFIDGYGTSTDEHVYSFLDENLSQRTYNYKLVQVDFDGSKTQVGEIEVIMNSGPKKYSLKQNYPNPFSKGAGGNPSTKIEYSLPAESFVNITIYDMLGKKIAQLVSEKKAAGNYVIDFNAGNLSNGIYLYKMTSNNFTLVKKMILLK